MWIVICCFLISACSGSASNPALTPAVSSFGAPGNAGSVSSSSTVSTVSTDATTSASADIASASRQAESVPGWQVPTVDFVPSGGPLSISSLDAQAASAGLSDVAKTYGANASNVVLQMGSQSLGSLRTQRTFADSSTIVKFVASPGATTYLDARIAGSASIGIYFNAGGGELFDSFAGYRQLGGISPTLTPGSTYYAKFDVHQANPKTTAVRIAFIAMNGTTVYSQAFSDTVPATQNVSGADDVQIGTAGPGVSQFVAYQGVRADSAIVNLNASAVAIASPAPSATPQPKATPAPTSAPTSPPLAVVSIPQGLYESCGMIWVPSTCLSDLDTFKAAGFTRVINYALLQATASDLTTYLSHAAADGIQVLVSVNSVYKYGGPGEASIAQTFPALAATCPSPCTTGPEFAAYVATIARTNLGTWGYYIGDETDVSAANESATGAVYSALKSVDPIHPTLFVGSEGFSTDLNTLTNLLQPFAPYADYLGADHYSIGAGDTTGATQLPVAQALHSLATSDGKPSVLVLQAYGFAEPEYNQDYCSPYPACGAFPTEAQMHALYENAIQGDPNVSMIFWYSWMDIQGSSNPAGNFANLQAAIKNS